MSTPVYPTSDRVLKIPELLNQIFTLLNNKSNANNARVCKHWSEVAFDCLWREVYDLYHLFNKLSPLGLSDQDDQYVFTHEPSIQQWKAFAKYAQRVRYLCYFPGDGGREHRLNATAFKAIERTRITPIIFPNMHGLRWNEDFEASLIFIHNGVTTCTIRHSKIAYFESAVPIFAHLYNMPNLTHLNLRLECPMSEIDELAGPYFASLSKLQEISLPSFHLTPRIVESLSRLPDLHAIISRESDWEWGGDSEDTKGFYPVLQEGAFPSLKHLTFCASFTDATSFLKSRFSPQKIITLLIESRETETPSTYRELISCIADKYKILTSLGLLSDLDFNWREQRDIPPPPEESIGMEILEPLLQYSKLQSLVVQHKNPLNIRETDIERIAMAFPSIQSLELNPTPTFYRQSKLSLQALLTLSHHCPNLDKLGLFINAYLSVDAPVDTTITRFHRCEPKHNLKELNVGLSIINPDSCFETALFLGEVCSSQCVLESGIRCDPFEGDDPYVASLLKQWSYVREIISTPNFFNDITGNT